MIDVIAMLFLIGMLVFAFFLGIATARRYYRPVIQRSREEAFREGMYQ
jgi:hypothetical protein